MSGKKVYQKQLKEISKYRRLEIEVLLSRYVEIFEFEKEPSKPDIDFSDLTNLLRAVVSISQSRSHSMLQVLLTPKEIDLVFRLYVCLRLDGRSQLLACQSLCEVCLINSRADSMLPDEILNDPKRLRTIVSYLVPVATSDSVEDILCDKLIAILDFPNTNSRQKAECLVLLTRILTSNSRTVSSAVCVSALGHLTDWIRSTDVTQATQQQFFGDKSAATDRKSSKLVAELSGGPCQERFTMLNVGRFFSQSQLLHLEVIFIFKNWLTCLHELSKENPESQVINRTLSAAQAEIASYCTRLLDQAERHLKSPPHRELVTSCLLEIVDLIFIICDINESNVRMFYISCSLLFDKCKTGELPPVLAVKLMSFLVNHAEKMGKDPSLFFSAVFGDLLGRKYSNSDFAHALIWYIINNSNMLCLNKGLTVRYFPNIAKLFVWNPRAFLPQFIIIFPMFIEDNNTLEILHYILDLPVVAATMELAKALGSGSSSGIARQIWENPMNQGYIRFLMRPESGKGDTLSQMNRIFTALNCYHCDVRVAYNYDVSLRLLNSFFTLLLEDATETHLRDIIPLILERCNLMYGPPQFCQSVNAIFSRAILRICQAFPGIVFNFFTEIREFLSQSGNICTTRDIYLSLLYIVGASAAYASEDSQRTDHLARLYDSLECTLYELLGRDNLGDAFWCAFAAVLARIAVVVQDLIPRCSLALTKIRQIGGGGSGETTGNRQRGGVRPPLQQRVDELVQLLTRANVGAGLLCPDSLSRWEWAGEDALTPVLKTIDALANCVLVEEGYMRAG